jgi:putative transposase
MTPPQGPNQRWSLDFVSDALGSGRRFRVLAVVDDFSRECLGLVADTSFSGSRVGRELDRIAEARGYPATIVSDNGTELASHAILHWQEERAVLWHYICTRVCRPLNTFILPASVLSFWNGSEQCRC